MMPWWQPSAAVGRYSEDEDSYDDDEDEDYYNDEDDEGNSDYDDDDDENELPSVLTFPSLLGPSRQVQIQREEDDEQRRMVWQTGIDQLRTSSTRMGRKQSVTLPTMESQRWPLFHALGSLFK